MQGFWRNLARPRSSRKGAPMVAGTGGLRILRFALARWGKGKSGAVRIGYVYLQEYSVILLMIAYPKNVQDDLSAANL